MVYIFSKSRPNICLVGITPIRKPTKFIFILFAKKEKCLHAGENQENDSWTKR